MARARATARGRSPWFTPSLFVFLEELRLHNDRDWFERNRDRYLRDVRDPMLRFVGSSSARPTPSPPTSSTAAWRRGGPSSVMKVMAGSVGLPW